MLSIKRDEKGEELYKARFVVGGHKDEAKNVMEHNATTIRQSSIRLLIALALAFDFNIWTVGANHAYLQSKRALQRDVFIKPYILDLAPDELLQIVKPIYGLSDSGDY